MVVAVERRVSQRVRRTGPWPDERPEGVLSRPSDRGLRESERRRGSRGPGQHRGKTGPDTGGTVGGVDGDVRDSGASGPPLGLGGTDL